MFFEMIIHRFYIYLSSGMLGNFAFSEVVIYEESLQIIDFRAIINKYLVIFINVIQYYNLQTRNAYKEMKNNVSIVFNFFL